MPSALADKPVLPEHLEPVWEGFFALICDRPVGPGWVGGISFLAIDAYARRRRWSGADFDRFHELIRAMDRIYLDHVNRKREP